MAKNWADLLPELLELCSGQLLLEDWLAFRSVCSAWRAATFEERFDVPWLMLAEDGRKQTERAELYSLFSSRIHKVVLPEGKRMRCSSSRGWIFTIDVALQVHALNPLSRAASRDIIKLPSVNKLFDRHARYYESMTRYTKFVLSASPASSPNYMIMAMPIYSYSTGLGLWKSGTKEWKVLTWQGDPVLDVVFYKGKFFAVNWSGDILAYDLDGPYPTTQVMLETPLEFREQLEFFEQRYLVESAGRLLLVARRDGEMGFRCRVFAIDLEARKWTELKSMGNASLFVGFSSSFSVQVDENQHTIKPNRIYFTRDISYAPTQDKEVGIYHVQDGRIEWLFDKKICGHSPRTLWIEPDGALFRPDHKFKKDC